jgi:hypothetical protein
MIEDEIPRLVAEKIRALEGTPAARRWAAVVGVVTRQFVLVGDGWSRWPAWFEASSDGVDVLLARAAGRPVADEENRRVLRQLEAFDVEDDGSDEWQHAVDLVTALTRAVEGADDVDALLEATTLRYLEGTFNIIANARADAAGKPVSQADAARHVPESEEWRAAVAFVREV